METYISFKIKFALDKNVAESVTTCYITRCDVRKACVSGKKIHVISALCVLKLKIFNRVRMYEALVIYHLLLLK